MEREPGSSNIGVYSMAKLFFKAIIAFFLALGALRILRAIFIIVVGLLLAIPLKYFGDSVSEPGEKTEFIYGLISPQGGYPPCFATDACFA
jgi:hypothetical protein